LVTRAATRSPEVRMAEASLLASQAARTAGNLSPFLNPQLEVRAQRATRGVVKDVALEGSAWLPFEFLGQGSARRGEAERYITVHQKALALTQAQAAARTVRSFGALSVANLRKSVLSELANNAAAETSLYEERLKAGDSIALDVATSQLEAALHRTLLHEAGADFVRHTAELKRLTGVQVSAEASYAQLPRQALHSVASSVAAQVSEAEAQFYAATRDRARAEGRGALSVGVIGGRGDVGEARYGLGLGYALPVFRTNQVEQARADAAWSVQSAEAQLVELRTSLETLKTQALPAAEAALKAAQETHAAGKGEWLVVLVARRDLSSLRLRHLSLLDRGWDVIAQIVEHTGELP
jgi:outer membrane protein TolC